MKRVLLLAALPLLLLSCIEGIELEENPRYRIPDDRQTLISFSSFNRFNSGNPMSIQDSLRFRDSILAIYGPTRDILFVDLDSGDEFNLEIPSVAPWQTGATRCEDGIGEEILLAYGSDFDVFDLEAPGGPVRVDREFVNNDRYCRVYRVPYP